MSPYTILVVEDDYIIAADLQVRLNRLGYSVPRTVATSHDALDAVRKTPPDLIILDIQLKGSLDGISTAALIQEEFQIPIIFLTSNTDALTFDRARKVIPEAFLSKPFRQKDLIHSIELAKEKSFNPKEEVSAEDTIILQDRIFIRTKNKMERVFFKDICYLEANRAYCKIITDKKNYPLYISLKSFIEKVPLKWLVRVHRSYIVNIQKISGFNDSYVYFNEVKLPISRNYKENFITLIHTI